jgi:hypothetical protein
MTRAPSVPVGRPCRCATGAGLLACLIPAVAQARVVKGPYITGLSAAGVDVRFELDVAAASTVEVRRDEGAGAVVRVFDGRAASPMAVVRATGLEPGTSYSYRVRVGAEFGGAGHFTTAPADDTPMPMTFLLYGDDRTDPAAHASVVRAMRHVASDFIVNTGDLVEDGANAQDWQSFFDIEAPLLRDRPLFVSIGNHELKDDQAGANFARYVGFLDESGIARPYGTARVGRTRFFFLNGMHDWMAGSEREWLEHALTQADTEVGLVWRLAVVHHGPWSVGPHGPNARLNAAGVPRLLAAHKIDLLLSGHDHIYERGDAGTMKYIVSGGGGAPLYDIEGTDPTERRAESTYHFVAVTVSPDAIRAVATRADGSSIERCGFEKGHPWDCDPSALVESPIAAPASPVPPPPVRPAASSPNCGCIVRGISGAAPSTALASFALAMGLAGARRRERGRG